MPEGGYSRESFWGDHTNHYDASGSKTGESRKSVWGDHTNHYDASGKKTGESRESLWGDHTNHYDGSGSKVGESRESLWGDHTNHYDGSGSKVGESRDSLWGDHVNHSGHWHPDTLTDDPIYGSSGSSAGSYGTSDPLLAGYGGGGVSVAPTPWTRWGRLGAHILVLALGTVASVALLLVLSILLSVLRSVPHVDALNAALTYRTMFGLLFPVSWVAAATIALVTSQILFTRWGNKDWSYGYRGLVVGAIAMIGLGLAGWVDGWGAILPAVGGLVGHLWGAIRDYDGPHRARSSVIAIAVAAVLVVVAHQAWIGYLPPAPSAQAAPAAPTFKKGDWVLVLESLPKKSKTRADAEAAAAKLGTAVAVIDSNRHKGLNDGYWAVVAADAYRSKKAASRACADFDRSAGPTCYPRQIG